MRYTFNKCTVLVRYLPDNIWSVLDESDSCSHIKKKLLTWLDMLVVLFSWETLLSVEITSRYFSDTGVSWGAITHSALTSSSDGFQVSSFHCCQPRYVSTRNMTSRHKVRVALSYSVRHFIQKLLMSSISK